MPARVRWWLGAVVAVAALGLSSGLLLGRAAPGTASRAAISGLVQEEPAGDPPPGATEPPAPTSGDPDAGSPVCGVHASPLDPADQVATLAVGRALLQYRPQDVSAAGVASIERLVLTDPDAVVVAANPALPTPVVATAWGRRLLRDEADASLLARFVDAYAAAAPRPGTAPCSPSPPPPSPPTTP
jgi:hypothetical protein